MRVQGPVPGRPPAEYESHRALTFIERLARERFSEPEIVWEMERLGYTSPVERPRRSIGQRVRKTLRSRG